MRGPNPLPHAACRCRALPATAARAPGRGRERCHPLLPLRPALRRRFADGSVRCKQPLDIVQYLQCVCHAAALQRRRALRIRCQLVLHLQAAQRSGARQGFVYSAHGDSVYSALTANTLYGAHEEKGPNGKHCILHSRGEEPAFQQPPQVVGAQREHSNREH